MSVDIPCFPLLVTCTILHVEDFIVSGIVILHLLKEHLAYYLHMSQMANTNCYCYYTMLLKQSCVRSTEPERKQVPLVT